MADFTEKKAVMDKLAERQVDSAGEERPQKSVTVSRGQVQQGGKRAPLGKDGADLQ